MAAQTCQNCAAMYQELYKDIVGFYPATFEQKSQKTNKTLKHIYIGNGTLGKNFRRLENSIIEIKIAVSNVLIFNHLK